MEQKTVLISGIGIAGPTLAYWLKRYGFAPTLVERAPSLRQNGYVVDFWGRGFDVAERMGLLPEIRSKRYHIEEVRLVDKTGEKVSGFNADIFRKVLGERFVTIERGMLARLVFNSVKDEVEAIFDDTVVSIERTREGMEVHFEKAVPRTFDMVVGADGLHSAVRSLLFGANESFEKRLGFKVAAFNLSGYPHRDEMAYVSYCVPGRQIARYALRDDLTGFLFIFRDHGRPAQMIGEAGRRGLLNDCFAGIGWESDEILRALESVADLYFDDVSQIRMATWSRDRAVLIGDAAFCPSLLAGEGSSLAMTAAFVLAGELKRSAGHSDRAFRRYEEMLRPFIERKQDGATWLGSWFVPKTRFGVLARNAVTKVMNIPATGRWMIGRMIADQLALPEYERAQ